MMLYNTLAAYFTVAGQKLPVSHFSLVEAASYPTDLSISLRLSTPRPLDEFLGQVIEFQIEPTLGQSRTWTLRCEQATLDSCDQGYLLKLICRSAWYACFRAYHQQRVFCQTRIPELVHFILSEQGISQAEVQWFLSHESWSRPQIVQGSEPDGDFLTRLCGRENILWFSRQEDEKEILHFLDHPQFLPQAKEAVIYRPAQSFEEEPRLGIFDLEYYHRGPLFPDECLDDLPLRLYSGIPCFQAGISTPGMPILSVKPLDYGPEILEKNLRERKISAQEIKAQGYRAVRFKSNYSHLLAGLRVDLASEAGLSYAQGSYQINYVKHEGVSIQKGEGAQLRYENTVIAQAQDSPWRGILKPRPLMPLVFQAKIESAHENSFLDELGRETVRSQLDSHASENTQASIPLPRLTPYAHAGGGMSMPLYPGAEVLMSCLYGEMDLPVILGTVFNDENKNIVNSTNPWHNRVRTQQNQSLLFDDTPAAPLINWSTDSGHVWEMRHLDRPGFFITCVGGLIMKSLGSFEWSTGLNYSSKTQGASRQRAGDRFLIQTKTGSIHFKAAENMTAHAVKNIHYHAENDYKMQVNHYHLDLEKNQTIEITQGDNALFVQGASQIESEGDLTLSSVTGNLSLMSKAGASGLTLTQAGVIIIKAKSLGSSTELDKQAGVINHY